MGFSMWFLCEFPNLKKMIKANFEVAMLFNFEYVLCERHYLP